MVAVANQYSSAAYRQKRLTDYFHAVRDVQTKAVLVLMQDTALLIQLRISRLEQRVSRMDPLETTAYRGDTILKWRMQ